VRHWRVRGPGQLLPRYGSNWFELLCPGQCKGAQRDACHLKEGKPVFIGVGTIVVIVIIVLVILLLRRR
jgi:hypothetical protein